MRQGRHNCVKSFAVTPPSKYNHYLPPQVCSRRFIGVSDGAQAPTTNTTPSPTTMPSANGHRPVIGVPLMRSRNEYNAPIYGMRRTYLRALHSAGAAPFTIPLEMDEDTYRALFERLDGVFLAGGEDIDPSNYGQARHELLGLTDAERDRVEILFTRWAVDEGKPILGVCRGHQVLSVALDGTMLQDVQAMWPGAERHDYRDNTQFTRNFLSHTIDLDPTSSLAQVMGARVQVNSLHHQAIDRLGRGLKVVGTTTGGVIEAVELEHHPFAVGVQWHPEELIADANMLGLFQAFAHASNGNGNHDGRRA